MITTEQQKENRLTAMKHFIGAGFTPAQAAGIVGNLMAESGMDPGIHQIGGGGGFGLAQWTWPSRKRALIVYASSHGWTVADLFPQLSFIVHEYSQPAFASALAALLKAATVTKAARAVCDLYERPGIPHLDRRIEWARNALKEYTASLECADVVS